MRYGHLETHHLTLRTLAPVFIGSGERLHKKEYIFDSRQGRIYFPDFPRLVEFLKSRACWQNMSSFCSSHARMILKHFCMKMR